MTPRSKLAVVGGFVRPRDSVAQGTQQAAFVTCQAIAQVGGYDEVHVYHENPGAPPRNGILSLPAAPACRLLDKTEMPATGERYQAIYLANGEQIGPAPQLLRPREDWAPVVCSVGTVHAGAQWNSLLVALASDAVRPGDGFIFKSRAAQALFRQVWEQWRQRLGLALPFPEDSVVIPNGVDVEAHRRVPALAAETRRLLRLRADDVVFLAFSRLSPGTKGDQQALIVRWQEVVATFPRALLLLAGAQVDRGFTADLRQLARAVGVGDRVLILENPYDLLANARGGLMSAADVFVHMTTGVEEASPLVVQEAMAHGLPVIATDWAGLPEVITPGTDGFLVPTRAAPVAPAVNAAVFALTDLSVGLPAGRAVSCEFGAFVAHALALADPERRQAMGAAARNSAEGRTLAMMARAYVDYFARMSAEAERHWSTRRPVRPLLHMDQVVAAQTAGRLRPEDRVRLANPDRAGLLTQGTTTNSEDPRAVAAALAALEAGVAPLSHLAEAMGTDFSSAARLLVRLLNYGVIAPDPASDR